MRNAKHRYERFYSAEIVIRDLRKPGLSTDDRRVAVRNAAFGAKNGFFRHFPGVREGFESF
jgi:hypothetical protein